MGSRQTDPDAQRRRHNGQELFDSLTASYDGRPDVTRGRMFASEGLAVRGKFFAFVGRDGRLVVKLPQHRTQDLIESGTAERVNLGGRSMREWVSLPLPSTDEDTAAWSNAIAEAHAFLAGS
jgi:hypothetical protein